MADDDLLVSLTYAGAELAQIRLDVDADSGAAESTADLLERAEARADDVRCQLGMGTAPVGSVRAVRAAPDPVTPPDWEQLLRRAREAIGEDQASYKDLVDAAQLRQIDRRFTDGWTASTRLDRYDIIAAVAAGVTAALVDYLVVAIPKESGLTNALRSLGTRDDNWLAALAKVPYDRVAEVPISGFAPMTHRVQTFGHDPLLGWVWGTMDILRGTLSGVSRQGVATVLDMAGSAADGLAVALALQAMHLVSDIVTPAGLPLPGWTALLAVDQQLPGAPHSVAELARFMYVRGYDTWHLPAMAAPIVAIEATLRGYLGLRQILDDDYRSELAAERAQVGSARVADLPRFATMSLIARAIAAAGNAGRFALSGANPLTLNYVVWLTFAKSLLAALKLPPPASAMIDVAHRNRLMLDAGWDQIDAALLPTISVPPQG